MSVVDVLVHKLNLIRIPVFRLWYTFLLTCRYASPLPLNSNILIWLCISVTQNFLLLEKSPQPPSECLLWLWSYNKLEEPDGREISLLVPFHFPSGVGFVPPANHHKVAEAREMVCSNPGEFLFLGSTGHRERHLSDSQSLCFIYLVVYFLSPTFL